jgi:solute carrier family 66, member 2
MPSLSDVGSFLLGVVVVSGVVWPYYPQARSILAKRDASAFSTTTSLVIIVSATLRCLFWLHKGFGIALLFQAIAAILAQFGMLWVVLRVQQDGAEGAGGAGAGAAVPVRRRQREERSLLDLRPADFWRWTDLASYILFHAGFVVVLLLVSSAFRGSPLFGELLGTASLGIEALLPVPTALNNARRRSADGLSLVLIGSWAAGDLFKTGYALAMGEPVQFVLCGVAQLLVDCVIVYQLVSFGGAGGAQQGKDAGVQGNRGGGLLPSSAVGPSSAAGGAAGEGSSGGSEGAVGATASGTEGDKRPSSLSRRGVTTL